MKNEGASTIFHRIQDTVLKTELLLAALSDFERKAAVKNSASIF